MTREKWIKLALSIAIPVILGFVVGIITNQSMNYQEINKPFFAPPAIIFPIVWTILYVFMGISFYWINEREDDRQKKAIFTYFMQLFVNLLWPIIFFTYQNYMFAFFWILLLLVLVFRMLYLFSKIDKRAFYLQIPYTIWLIFAAILNLAIVFLNKIDV